MSKKKWKILDLFCKAGGAGVGYNRAGFDVTGVDIEPQKRYPFEFVQDDALDYVAENGHLYDLIHASPPCQAYTKLVKGLYKDREYPDLVEATRRALKATGLPYVIENVPGAPLENPLMLCGTMFGLLTIRHRLFETNPVIWWPPFSCAHVRKTAKQGRKPNRETEYITVTGCFSDAEFGRVAMGIDWMVRAELTQAVPPAFTQWIGEQMMNFFSL